MSMHAFCSEVLKYSFLNRMNEQKTTHLCMCQWSDFRVCAARHCSCVWPRKGMSTSIGCGTEQTRAHDHHVHSERVQLGALEGTYYHSIGLNCTVMMMMSTTTTTTIMVMMTVVGLFVGDCYFQCPSRGLSPCRTSDSCMHTPIAASQPFTDII